MIINSTNKTISVRASVVWSKITGTKKGKEDEVIPLYTAGMRFINLSDDQIKEFTIFIEGQEDFSREKTYKVGDPGELRCSIRFLVDPPFNMAVLKVSENYGVKKISLGGMLIESKVPLKIEEKMPMEMLLPGNTQIRFSGRIASCLEIPGVKGPEEGVSRYNIGIEFLEIEEEDREKLQGFVALRRPNRFLLSSLHHIERDLFFFNEDITKALRE